MSKKHLNYTNISSALQQMGRKRMAQCMQRDRFGNPDISRGFFEQPGHMPGREVLAEIRWTTRHFVFKRFHRYDLDTKVDPISHVVSRVFDKQIKLNKRVFPKLNFYGNTILFKISGVGRTD